MTIKQQHILDGIHGRPIPVDLHIPENHNGRTVIFCHGYKGFKDWGCWDLVAERFTAANFIFLKFNFSHNGGTISQPIDFPDPEAFALNNFTKELDDLNTVIDFTTSAASINPKDLHLVGHSRGGGIVTIKTAEDKRVSSVSSWAGVSDFKARFADEKTLAYWKEKGVIYIENSRTKQQLPHYYQFYEDFIANEDRFNIRRATENLNVPHLIVHGTEDPTVNVKEAKALRSWNPEAQLQLIDGADHVFGGAHPWNSQHLPQHLNEVVDVTLRFLK
ncbi:alpha/beta fold hydrolase [Robertkochia marina]|uniref:Alpha/beta fold hydrolase n=1 Tax=Robertkochia marina TaxID=1227945 RepID=A0A4S3M4T9_9FLAO|nr:alpha/beta fold hydrolase [Robertkochia marina]THD69207.1 alpha/beta fold hydrolase [Robertkochia marina]TRZ47534.1 alpha/beta fold hydrolase [Robertkochia marina]